MRSRMLVPTAARATAWLMLIVALAACAPRSGYLPRPAPATLPPYSPLASRSLSEGDAWLRYYLMGREWEPALQLLGKKSRYPSDRLLRALQRGVLLHNAGRHGESNRAFAYAEAEADRRYTRSIRRGIGSLLLNDRVLAYTPTRAELGLVAYYRILNYLALGQPNGAGVEARKLDALLARSPDPEKRCGEAFLHYLSGLVHDAVGEGNDALVSLRHAEARFATCDASDGVAAPPELRSDLARAARRLGLPDGDAVDLRDFPPDPQQSPSSSGDVLVLIEHGFAAHPVEEELYLPISAAEVDGLAEEDRDGIGRAASRISAELLAKNDHRVLGGGGGARDGRVVSWADGSEADLFFLKVAWPVLRLEALRPAGVRVRIGELATEPAPLDDVSGVLADRWVQRRPEVLGRMIGRALVKRLLVREAERKAEKQGGEVAAMVVGLVANTAANALEQADTRSWTLLPDRVSLARFRLPPGEHIVTVEVLDRWGSVAERIELPPVRIRAGERVFLSRRVWGPELGSLLPR